MWKGRLGAAVTVTGLVVLCVFAAGPGVAARSGHRAAVKRYRLTARLSAAREVPRPKGSRKGHGLFVAVLTLKGKKGTLAWKLTFGGLSGRVTAAHVHVGPPGKAGPIAIPLCGPCHSGQHGTFTGPIGGKAALLRAILGGDTYANVHTRLNPPGEIRGQVKAVAVAGTGKTVGTVAVSTRTIKGLGPVLVDARGLTLYMFVPDKRRKVTCVSTCAAVWPPLELAAGEKAVARGAARAKLLGSDPDPQGGRVVTYHGWPLYTYAADRAPGRANGQGLKLNGGYWYVLSPSGAVVHTKPHSGGGGGY